VFEVRPHVDWHKGSAMSWIVGKLGKQNTLTIFVGDDRTDEDAFRSLGDGITFKVGEPGGTSAHYHLDGPASVRGFLNWLAKVGNEGEMP
jgi:trehalose-phosphatase